MTTDRTLRVLPTPAAVASAAAEIVVASARRAIEEGGRFSLVLSGGSTPQALYTLLAGEPYRDQIDWPRVEIFFGDERTVPPDHGDSNFRMAKLALLDHVPVPAENVHRLRGEIPPEEAAIEYGQLLKQRFGEPTEPGPDLVLLGIGDDGHTASLFPHTAALDEQRHRCVANFVPKLNTWPLTLTAPFLNRAREVLVLVTGAKKVERLKEVLEGPQDPKRLPIQFIQPTAGKTTWLIDAAAAEMG